MVYRKLDPSADWDAYCDDHPDPPDMDDVPEEFWLFEHPTPDHDHADELRLHDTIQIKTEQGGFRALYRTEFTRFNYPTRMRHKYKGTLPDGWYCDTCTDPVSQEPVPVTPYDYDLIDYLESLEEY